MAADTSDIYNLCNAIDLMMRLGLNLSLNSRIETGIARCLIMLISTIGSVLLTDFIAPTRKFTASIIIAAVVGFSSYCLLNYRFREI